VALKLKLLPAVWTYETEPDQIKP